MGNISVTTTDQASWPLDVRGTPDEFAKKLEATSLDGMGAAAPDRWMKVGVKALTGAAIHAGTGGVIAWTNPETVSIIILDVYLAITTVSTGACTLDIGTTATSATTTSDNIFDGLDATTTAPVYYAMRDAALDSGANIGIKPLAAGKWVTIDEKSGDATGLVGTLYVLYILA